jgi:hypothetical protein
MNYWFFFLILFLTAFVAFKLFTIMRSPIDGFKPLRADDFKPLNTKEKIIDQFNVLKGMPISFVTVGQEDNNERFGQDKILSVNFGDIKEFEIDDRKEYGAEWCLLVIWVWSLYKSQKSDEKLIDELCVYHDSKNKIEECIDVLEGKKLTLVNVVNEPLKDSEHASIQLLELYFEDLILTISLPEEGFDAVYLATPTKEVFSIARVES